ncbi:alpha/beta hydrolase [Arenibaculum pallidiluteum]|uniref:alpha/beta hydrolase n=1 Tax=Arenibaculum pallidiluteum TaxID=2812559 RepID=UPI001A96A1B3|nr:alpha/beta hydrolase-fold protein [Arenibaculum pallidiluteum]
MGERPIPAPVTVPGAEQWDIVSLATGGVHRIMLWLPQGPPPAGGFPVLYLLDGNATFATAVDALRIRIRRNDATGVPPAVVVGIGYPTDEPFAIERRSVDLTPPGTGVPGTGGATAFLRFIEEELKPAVARALPVDPGRQSILGHSYGGLFVLHVLFTSPGSFQTYVAGSPSIWFGDRRVLAGEAPFAASLAERPAGTLRLLVGVGGHEQDLSPAERRSPHAAARAVRKAGNRMVDEAAALAARLAPLSIHGLRTEFVQFAGEDHASVLPVLIGRGIGFALLPSD